MTPTSESKSESIYPSVKSFLKVSFIKKYRTVSTCTEIVSTLSADIFSNDSVCQIICALLAGPLISSTIYKCHLCTSPDRSYAHVRESLTLHQIMQYIYIQKPINLVKQKDRPRESTEADRLYG